MTNRTDLLIQKSIGKIHFIGIGGIGMSGIAEILHNLGYEIQGSDNNDNYNIIRLKELGIKIYNSHNQDNIENVSVIVVSTAITDDNPEIVFAIEKKIPIIKRSEMLAELMRLKFSIAISGTHGKTTTTSLTAEMFESYNIKPTVINGGIINSKNTNAYLGSSDYLIAEADESDGTFIRVPSTIGIITNINPDHLDFYGNFDNLMNAFNQFIENLPFYGFGVLCIDHPNVRKLNNSIIDRKIITYGIESVDADIRATNIKQDIDGSKYDVVLSSKINQSEEIIKDIYLPSIGIHNVLNSLAPISIAIGLKLDKSLLNNIFKNFKGVKRRFTKIAEKDGITIIDDYAHHPEEIKATLKTAKSIMKNENSKLIVVVQPHRYSRLQNLFSEFINSFIGVDILIVTDVYSAGEDPIDGINKYTLSSSIQKANYIDEVIALYNYDDLISILKKKSAPGDLIIFIGAGDITKHAYNFVRKL